MKKAKLKEIFMGIISAAGLWIFGHLLSGRLSFVEDIKLYSAGPLVFIFPFVIGTAFVAAAKFCEKKDKPFYFKSFVIASLFPVLSYTILVFGDWLIQPLMQNRSFISDVFSVVQLIFSFPSVALMSVLSQTIEYYPSSTDGWQLVFLIAVNALPVIIGLICAVKIYKTKKDILKAVV